MNHTVHKYPQGAAPELGPGSTPGRLGLIVEDCIHPPFQRDAAPHRHQRRSSIIALDHDSGEPCEVRRAFRLVVSKRPIHLVGAGFRSLFASVLTSDVSVDPSESGESVKVESQSVVVDNAEILVLVLGNDAEGIVVRTVPCGGSVYRCRMYGRHFSLDDRIGHFETDGAVDRASATSVFAIIRAGWLLRSRGSARASVRAWVIRVFACREF